VTSGAVDRLEFVAWRSALWSVHHASLATASDTALHFTKRVLTQESAADGKAIMRNFHRFDLIEATWVAKKGQ
jgi:hypothetical protein